MATPISACRICGSTSLEEVLSLGNLPAVNSFLSDASEIARECRHPLAIVFCPGCTHVQLTHMLDPKDIFTDYIYFSSMSETVVRWGQTLAARYARELNLNGRDLVAELASNDGAVLKAFAPHARIYGVEPAQNIAAVADREGVPTRAEFFDAKLGAVLRAEVGPARLVIARNVVAHVPAVVDFVEGVRHWLADDGIFHVEVPYVRDMIDRLEFDTIYHEHLSYFSLTALDRLFRQSGLVLWDVERIAMHGGSLIVRGRLSGTPTAAVERLLGEERETGLTHVSRFRGFAEGTRALQRRLPEFIGELRAGGRRVTAYGAAAKGVVLTNYCGVGQDLVDYVADRSPYKQGKLMPGTHVPVVAPQRVLDERPDFLLVLAWNFFEEIATQLDAYHRAGGRFVIPIPEPFVHRSAAEGG